MQLILPLRGANYYYFVRLFFPCTIILTWGQPWCSNHRIYQLIKEFVIRKEFIMLANTWHASTWRNLQELVTIRSIPFSISNSIGCAILDNDAHAAKGISWGVTDPRFRDGLNTEYFRFWRYKPKYHHWFLNVVWPQGERTHLLV